MADELERAANSVAGVWLDPYEATEAIVDRDTAKAEVDRLRRNLAITSQALAEARAELAHCRPVADAAHAYCAARIYAEDHPGHGWDIEAAEEELITAHRATTPSAVPSSHVIVERAELERLRQVEMAVIAWRFFERMDEYQREEQLYALAAQLIEALPGPDVMPSEDDMYRALDPKRYAIELDGA